MPSNGGKDVAMDDDTVTVTAGTPGTNRETPTVFSVGCVLS